MSVPAATLASIFEECSVGELADLLHTVTVEVQRRLLAERTPPSLSALLMRDRPIPPRRALEGRPQLRLVK